MIEVNIKLISGKIKRHKFVVWNITNYKIVFVILLQTSGIYYMSIYMRNCKNNFLTKAVSNTLLLIDSTKDRPSDRLMLVHRFHSIYCIGSTYNIVILESIVVLCHQIYNLCVIGGQEEELEFNLSAPLSHLTKLKHDRNRKKSFCIFIVTTFHTIRYKFFYLLLCILY